MNKYLPVTSESSGRALSCALWGLTRPPQVRQPAEANDDMFDVVCDAAGQWYLEVDSEFDIPVHPLAEIDGIADILLGAGLSQGEVDQLESLVIALRGQRMRSYDYFPAVFKSAAKTWEQITWPARP